jgi:hypothetical protein
LLERVGAKPRALLRAIEYGYHTLLPAQRLKVLTARSNCATAKVLLAVHRAVINRIELVCALNPIAEGQGGLEIGTTAKTEALRKVIDQAVRDEQAAHTAIIDEKSRQHEQARASELSNRALTAKLQLRKGLFK